MKYTITYAVGGISIVTVDADNEESAEKSGKEIVERMMESSLDEIEEITATNIERA